MKEWSRALLLMFLSLAVSSCGGSGGEGGPIGTGGAPPTATLSSTTVSLDSSVPPAIASAITDVLSPTSAGTIPGSVQIETIPGSDAMILAMDASGELRLAAMTSGPTTTLNADTTAVALVRIALGALPSGVTAAQANQEIRGAPEYAALVSAVDQAIKSGLTPLADPAVANSVIVVTGQVAEAFERQVRPASSAALAYATPRAQPPLPFTLVSGVGGVGKVYLDGVTSAGEVELVNSMLIAWAASSLDESGHEIAVPHNLLPVSLWSALKDTLHPWLGPSAIAVPGNGGKGMDVKIQQTDQTRLINDVGLMTDTVKLTLSLMGSQGLFDKCVTGMGSALLKSEEMQAMAAEPTMESFLAYLKSIKSQSPDKFHSLFVDCIPRGKGLARLFMGELSKQLSGLAQIRKAYDAVSLIAKAKQVYDHWSDEPRLVAVCLGQGLFRLTVADCAKEFRFANPNPVLVPNARYTPNMTALTEGEKITAIPVGVVHESSDAAEAVVKVLNDQTGTLVASGTGTATITARDPFTGAKGSYPVTVVRPVIKPGVVKLGIGQTITLSLTDQAGNSVITDQSGITWASTDDSIVQVLPEASFLFYPNGVIIKGLKAGKVSIKVLNPAELQAPITAEVEVVGTVANVCKTDEPTYAPSGCELPRLVAKNPYTPIPAGQAVPLSEVIGVLPGTCGDDTAYIHVDMSGVNWKLLIPETVDISTWRSGGSIPVSFMKSPSDGSGTPHSDLISLQPTAPGSIALIGNHLYSYNYLTGSRLLIRRYYCVFQQAVAPSGP